MRIGDFCKTNLCTYSEKEKWGEIHYLDTGNITRGKIAEIQTLVPGVDTIPSRARRKVQINDIIYSTVRPNQRHYGIIKSHDPNMLVSTGFVVITVDPQIADPDFIYYYLTQDDVVETLEAIGEQSTSAYPSIKPVDIENLEIELPLLEVQKAAGAMLRQLEKKRAVNDEINDNLQQQAVALYKSWFVDFSSAPNYEMVDSEIGKIPYGWRVYRLAEFLPVITGKKNANVSSEKGDYPFFSCSQGFAWTDDYSFEGHAILVAGNGDFNVKWYKGKFEAYQRTYVLIPYEERNTSWLYYAVKYNLTKITSAARGSVIKFITKGNLENFAFAAPSDLSSCEIIDTFAAINRKIDCLTQENYRLAVIRNALLPKLMCGEIDVSDIDA